MSSVAGMDAPSVIWPMPTVLNVSRLWTSAVVDNSVVFQTDGAAIDATKDHLARALCGEAHTFGVDAHPGDTQFAEGTGSLATTIECRWSPTTTTVELVGGCSDGCVVTVADVWRPHLVPVPMPVPMPLTTLVDEPVSAILPIHEYRIDGWDEHRRRWVMRFTGY